MTSLAERVKLFYRVLEWLRSIAEERGLKWKQDAEGNMVIYRPGSGGGETAPPVVIQVLTLPSCT